MYTLKTPDIDAKSFAVRAVPDAEVAAIQGDSFVHRNRFADAEPLLKKSLQLDPMNVPARESLGLMEFEKGNHAEAERWMRDAIELHSENYLIYYYHAMLSSEASLTQELNTHVEEDLRRSIALNPDFAPAHSVLGLTLIRRHDDWPRLWL